MLIDHLCFNPFFFGNGKLAQERNTDGIWFSEICSFPISDLRMFARQYIHNNKEQERTTAAQPSRGPREPVSLDGIAAKLDKVDAYAIDYGMWVKVCAGLKREYGDAAFEVARNWSEAPGKTTLTRQKWDSFGRNGTPVTIATVLKVIRDYGQR